MKIGILTRIDVLENKNRIFVNETYINKILEFRHIPILLYGYENPEDVSSYCDALLIPGGYDIASFYLKSKFDPNCSFYKDTSQDIRDFLILDAFVKTKKPILGICRGIQLINVYFHGNLHQDINSKKHADLSSHKISITPNSFLEQCMPPIALVNSFHHQVIAQLGEQLSVCATSEDGYIEAIQHDTLPIIAVQWHPELMEDDFIFPYFFYLIKQSLF